MTLRATVTKEQIAVPPAPPRALGVDALVEALFGAAAGWLRCVARGGGSQVPQERWFRRQQGRWAELGSFKPRTEPGPAAFPTKEVSLSPFVDLVLKSAPAAGAPPQDNGVSLVWGVVGLRMDARRPGEPRERIAPDGQARALEQLSRLTIKPNVVVAEGNAIAAIWKLAVPVTPARAQTLVLQIRQRVGGDSRRVDLREALVAMPGPLAADRVFPATPVRAEAWNKQPIDIAALEGAIQGHQP